MTTLMVQSDRLMDNFHIIQQQIGNVAIIPELSGNAYGLGDVAIAKILAGNGVQTVSASRLEEAERICENVGNLDVLLLTPYVNAAEIQRIVDHDIIATVSSSDQAVMLSGVAGKNGKRARVHLKFDTGWDHSGFLPDEAGKAAQNIKYLQNIDIAGIYTQLAPEAKAKRAQIQYDAFMGILQSVSRVGLQYGIAHMASSTGAMEFPYTRLDAIRVGRGLAGRVTGKDKWGLQKIGRLVSEICDIRWVPAGHVVGRNEGVKLRRAGKVALVPVGRADGLLHMQKSKAVFGRPKYYCEISGKRALIIGRPGHTHTVLDVTNLNCSIGDNVSFNIDPLDVSPTIRRDYV